MLLTSHLLSQNEWIDQNEQHQASHPYTEIFDSTPIAAVVDGELLRINVLLCKLFDDKFFALFCILAKLVCDASAFD